MKKYVGWVVIGVFVLGVLALVYVFITKGYSGIQNIVPEVTPTASNNPSESETNTQETGNVSSTKISLVITSPKAGSVLNSTNVVVTGKTVPGAEVFVNDKEGKADKNGTFSISIGLEEGENQLVVSANDSEGNVAEENLAVTVTSFE